MNKIILLGRLVRDPEVEYTKSEKIVAKITLAVNRAFKNSDGQQEADFIPVIIWGKQAELIGNSCKKGHRLFVEGRLQIRSYDAKDGSKRWVTEVIANSFEFIEHKAKSGSEAHAVDQQPSAMDPFGSAVPFDEEIPF